MSIRVPAFWFESTDRFVRHRNNIADIPRGSELSRSGPCEVTSTSSSILTPPSPGK
jgi:hypothetical protein